MEVEMDGERPRSTLGQGVTQRLHRSAAEWICCSVNQSVGHFFFGHQAFESADAGTLFSEIKARRGNPNAG